MYLFLFSIIVNQHYGNQGAFPMDSFHFFDSGYRVLNGDIPFVDYWLVKGPLLDYIQALLFYMFGGRRRPTRKTSLSGFYVYYKYQLEPCLHRQLADGRQLARRQNLYLRKCKTHTSHPNKYP